MAKQGKTKLSNIFVWIILALLIIGLAGFGATNFGSARQAVATVGSADVSMNAYYRSLEAELRAYAAQLNRNLTLAEAQAFGIDQQVLGRLLSGAAIEHETSEFGLSAGDSTLAADIRSRSEFQGIDGNFDPAAYEFALQRAGLSVPEFEASIRAEIAGGLLQTAVAANAALPQSYSDQILGFLGERRSFTWVGLTEADLASPLPEPTPDQLRSFYDDDPEAFMRPEQRDITFAWLRPEDVLDDVTFNEEDLLALYEERSALYNLPERRLVERLVFGNTAEAQEAVDRVTSGEQNFEALVDARGLSLEDVDMGDVTKEDLGQSADAVFDIAEPGIVGPVETSLGPALFRVNAILAARVTEYEDVQEELRAEFAGDRARREIADRITEFDDLLAGGASVEELAAETGMSLSNILWSPGSDEDIAGYDDFVREASQASVDDFPSIVELSDGGVFAMRLNAIVPAAPEPFETATDKVAEAWVAEQRQAALSDLASEIAAQVENGARLSSLGYITAVESQTARTAFIDNAPGNLVEQVFGAEPVKPVVVEGDSVVVVALVTEIHAANPDDPDLARIAAAIENDAAQSVANDLLIAFTRAVQNEAGISVDQASLNAIHSQFP